MTGVSMCPQFSRESTMAEKYADGHKRDANINSVKDSAISPLKVRFGMFHFLQSEM